VARLVRRALPAYLRDSAAGQSSGTPEITGVTPPIAEREGACNHGAVLTTSTSVTESADPWLDGVGDNPDVTRNLACMGIPPEQPNNS
jgi:hypothetical protein